MAAHHLLLATFIHAEFYTAPAIYVDKRDLLIVIHRIYILVHIVLPEPFNLRMRSSKCSRATSFATFKSQSEQNHSEVQDHKA